MSSGDALAWFGVPWPPFNDGITYKDKLSPLSSPCTILDYYASKYKDSAPKLGWLQRIQNGQISINGSIVTATDAIVRGGNVLLYHRLPWKEPDTPFKLSILFEDNYILALNKPSGLQVLPGGLFQQRTVLTQLQWRDSLTSRSKNENNSSSTPSPVHRLGRGTSGILLCAKSQLAKSKLAMDFASGSRRCLKQSVTSCIRKTYRALASGIIAEDEIFVEQAIGMVAYPGVAKGVYAASPTGKPSESKVHVLFRDHSKNSTLVEVEIYSGRPHQIRIHLAYLGYPLVGDPLYVAGGRPAFNTSLNSSESSSDKVSVAMDGGYERPAYAVPGDCGYHLHAYRLSFLHPIIGESIELEAEPPSILCSPETEVERGSPSGSLS